LFLDICTPHEWERLGVGLIEAHFPFDCLTLSGIPHVDIKERGNHVEKS
jgi:hypothetical protein